MLVFFSLSQQQNSVQVLRITYLPPSFRKEDRKLKNENNFVQTKTMFCFVRLVGLCLGFFLIFTSRLVEFKKKKKHKPTNPKR